MRRKPRIYEYSLHTNKLKTKFKDGQISGIGERLWCGVCNVMLPKVVLAIYHMHGKNHKQKLSVKNGAKDIKGDKGSSTVSVGKEEPQPKAKKKRPADKTIGAVESVPAKKMKEKTSGVDSKDLKCSDCNLTFTNVNGAIMHFKGKRHIKTISDKAFAKQSTLGQRGVGVHMGGHIDGIGNDRRRYGQMRGISGGVSSLHGGSSRPINADTSYNYNMSQYGRNSNLAPPDRYFASMSGLSTSSFQARNSYNSLGTQLYDFDNPSAARKNYYRKPSSKQPSGTSNINHGKRDNSSIELESNQPYGLFY